MKSGDIILFRLGIRRDLTFGVIIEVLTDFQYIVRPIDRTYHCRLERSEIVKIPQILKAFYE